MNPLTTPIENVGQAENSSELAQIRILMNRMAVSQQVFFNVEEAAEFTRLSVSSINRLKDEGRIPFSNGGLDRVIFHREDLVVYMLENKTVKVPEADRKHQKCQKKVPSGNGLHKGAKPSKMARAKPVK